MIQDIGIVDMQGDELDQQSQLSTNEECDNTHIEEEIEFEIKEAVKKPSNQQIDFPLISKFKRPLKVLLPIPSNYQFDDISQYKETMLRLEDENYFQTFRNSLKYHISKKFEDSQTSHDGFYVVSNFSVASFSYQQTGLILDVKTIVRIPRYQKQKAEMMNNQIIIFVNVDTQKIFVGKTIVEKNSNQFEDKYKISEDNQVCKDQEVEQVDQFENIGFSQSFQIIMDTQNYLIIQFLINLNDDQSKFKLVIPSDYWHSLEKSLNCQLQFQKLNEIAFPGQTLKAEKGSSSFPKYSFLESDNEKVEQFKSMLENEIQKEKQLDESQKVALRHALFNENAIIQGPPGTGKTFLASKIVNILKNVHNKLTRKPIIVISLKNISLDQLLVKITNQNKSIKILRLGYGITDQRVKKCILNNGNFIDAPKIQYPQSSKEAVDSIDKNMNECIENIKKRKDQLRFQQKKEIQLPKNLENSIKKKLIELLRNQLSFLNEDQDLEEEIQDKIFQKWMKGKLSIQKLEKYLSQAGIYLTGEDQEYLSRSIDIQKTDQELNLYPSERSIMKFLKNITSLEQLSLSFSKFLIDNQDTIEIDIIQNQMNNYSHSRSSALMEYNSNYQDELSTFMEDFDVIGMTFTGYQTYYQAIQKLGAEIVVVEEASEVIESHFYPVLTPNVKHLIQIGDHQQLRPLIKSTTLQKQYNYQMSYFERLIKINKVDHATLCQQRRMVPQFANFTRIFYGSKYIDAPNTKSLQFEKKISKNGMYMLQHSYPDQIQMDQSYVNTFEASYIKYLVMNLLNNKKITQQSISILATYKAQVVLIQSLLSKQKLAKEVKVYTVDQFQGNENDIIILSCVRSNMENKSGFVLNDHRINVAFSRAKVGFFCIGNFNQYRKKSATWEKIVDLSQQQFSLGSIGVEAQYENLEIKALDQEQFLLRGQEKSPKICGICKGKSHIINCSAPKQLNTAFQHMQLNDQNVSQYKKIDHLYKNQIKMIQDIGIVDMQGDELDLQSQLSTNEECDNTHIEKEIEFEIKEAVKKPSNQQIDFPLISKLKRPLKALLPIPSNYQFDDISQYKETMFRLEDENYFQTFRNSLKYHISQKFEDSQTNRDGFYVISNFSVGSFSFQQEGLLLNVNTLVRIPRYQQKKAEMMSNQVIIFVSVDTQKIFVGKTIVETNSNLLEDGDDENIYEDEISEDNKQYEDEEVEQEDQFEKIEFSQSFQIRMDTLNNLDEFLINLNDNQSKFKLVIPSDYWHSLEKSLNCQLQFQKLDKIAFPGQTLKAEKGFSNFPKYSFLQSDNEVEYFKSMLENEIYKENQLDESQKVALRHVLFNENAIVQGPPGTGKTFLASKIVSILKNVHNNLTRKPIIVISLKNISLDQLLVKITNQSKFIKILRLGYRVTDKRVKKFTLNNENFQDAPKFQYPKYSKEAVDSIDKHMKECIENIKKRKDQSRFQQEKETQFPKNLENSIKKKLIELLRNQLSFLNEDQDLEEEIQDKIFQKWMKGKLSFQKLEKYLTQAGVYLTGEDKEYLSRRIGIQQTDQELNLYPSERSIMKFLKNITSLEQLSISFSKFLIDNQDTIEIDIIQNQMNNYSHSRSSALMRCNSNYQDELSTFMEDFDVIGMTFTGYQTYYQAIQKLGAEIVVVEEASEVIESHFYPVLTPNVKHLIQIGDHQQLRPLIKSTTLQKQYNYQMSYFERLIKINKVDHATLCQQRRMVPQFANFTRIFYGSKYIDAPNTKSLQFENKISKNGMYMLQHSYPDQIQMDQSYVNTFEASYIKYLVMNLLNNKKITQQSISILATYKAQVVLIQSLLSKQKLAKEVKVYTVDQFQGNENDIVILSCVRSNMENKSGFVLNDHRINVAFSRAKVGFFCIGNFNQYRKKSATWEKIIDLSQQQFSLGAIGVEAQYKNLEIKALDQEQFLLRGQEKTPKICGICKGMSHIINCSAPKQLNTAFQHMQLNDQNASQVYQQSKKYQKTKNYQKQFYK
ncbi:hypothetical protein ABPG74_012511 [Tetrahymena malaccensis]